MSNWKKYNCRFKKTKISELEELGIKSNESYDTEVLRIDLDEVCAYNPADENGTVTLRIKSGEMIVVDADIEDLDNYFFE